MDKIIEAKEFEKYQKFIDALYDVTKLLMTLSVSLVVFGGLAQNFNHPIYLNKWFFIWNFIEILLGGFTLMFYVTLKLQRRKFFWKCYKWTPGFVILILWSFLAGQFCLLESFFDWY